MANRCSNVETGARGCSGSLDRDGLRRCEVRLQRRESQEIALNRHSASDGKAEDRHAFLPALQ